MNNIKVILWDIDGTLLNFHEAEKAAIRKCFEIYNLGACTDEMLKDYSIINRGYWERLERGEVTKIEVLEGRFRDFFAKYGLDVSLAPEVNAQYQVRLGDTIVFYANGFETVTALKGRIPQYAVTNGTKVAQDRKLKNSNLINMLDGVFISEVVGIEKPGVGFFDRIFDVIGVGSDDEVFQGTKRYKKSEVLIIGDSLTSDIQGGNNADILTCWFNPDKKKVETDLRIDYEIDNLKQVLDIVDGVENTINIVKE